MAFSSHPFCASFGSLIAPNETPIIGNSKHTNFTPSAQKWHIGKHNGFPSSTPLETSHDQYLTKYSSISDSSSKHGQKLEVFKHVLSKVGEDPLEGLNMIDAVQRLCIDYYFQEEIEAILQKQFMIFNPNGDCNYSLHEVALRFRLLRQQGYFASADIFDNLKDKEGIFRKKLIGQDINGLMGLYEASQLSIEGEDLLDEAGEFSGQLLAASMAHLDHRQAKIVEYTLGNPHHKSLAKFMAKNFFVGNNYQEYSNVWINVLQELAKTEFNMVQSLHHKEIFQISKWWRDVGLSKELKFARDQPLKWYIWSMACLTDPRLSQERIELTKPISFIYIIDDIFDVYGTLEELTLFSQAINKWDIDATEELPDYMKICFKSLNDMTNEISHKIHQKHGWNPLHSLRKTWSSLCNAFLEEAKLFANGKLPKAEEYLRNGRVSSGVHVVLVHAFFLLGEGLCNHTVELVDDMPRIISSTASILRLWDDLGSAKDENQEGHDGSYVECYMKEHHGCSKEEARQQTMNMISEAWKCLNKECLSPTPFPLTFAKASLNLARLVPLMYGYDDNQCLPTLEEHMKSMVYESVAI